MTDTQKEVFVFDFPSQLYVALLSCQCTCECVFQGGWRVEGIRFPLTKVRLVWTALQLHSFRAALNQEVPHQLVGDVTCNKRE